MEPPLLLLAPNKPPSLPPSPLQNATKEQVLAQIMALPNWNASSENWKPMLYLSQGVEVQQAALAGLNVSYCTSPNPTGLTC